MAYTPATLSLTAKGITYQGGQVWEYTTSDPFSTIDDAGYVTDASSKGMRVGDLVFINIVGTGGKITYVSAISAGAATLVAYS